MFTHGPTSVIDGDIMFWEETDFANFQDDDVEVKVCNLMNEMNIVKVGGKIGYVLNRAQTSSGIWHCSVNSKEKRNTYAGTFLYSI